MQQFLFLRPTLGKEAVIVIYLNVNPDSELENFLKAGVHNAVIISRKEKFHILFMFNLFQAFLLH